MQKNKSNKMKEEEAENCRTEVSCEDPILNTSANTCS